MRTPEVDAGRALDLSVADGRVDKVSQPLQHTSSGDASSDVVSPDVASAGVVSAGVAGPRVMVVDGNSLLHRSFHAQASSGLHTRDGRPMWAVRGLVSQLVSAVQRLDPDFVVVGFDDPHASARREKWPHYKANRSEKPATLEQQLQLAVQVCSDLGIGVVVPPGWEADDVLATVAAQVARLGGRCVVVTSDRDSFALIDDTTSVLRIINGGVEASPLLTPQRLELMLGIRAGQYRDLAALRGDASDNLAGVSGIGAKTAAKLLRALGCAEAAFADAAAGGELVRAAVGKAVAARLDESARAIWAHHSEIMTMRTDIALVDGFATTSGFGRLPLSVTPVATAFDLLQLTWTIPKALRVLCHEDEDHQGATARDVVSSSWGHGPERYHVAGNAGGFRRPVPPPLPRRMLVDQLSLFE